MCCSAFLLVCGQGEERYSFENVNPFVEPEEISAVASVGYRYLVKLFYPLYPMVQP